MAMKTSLAAGVGGCCIILALSALIPTEQLSALPPRNGFQLSPLAQGGRIVTESPQPTSQSGSAQSFSAPPARMTNGRTGESFAPVLLRDMQRPLRDNEVWIVQALLLNPAEGSLAHPGKWAAPAKLLSGNAHWK
jgi:hypothetical protein